MRKQYPSKADKAQALLDSGAVRLYPGRGYAEVVGSRGDVYRITKQDGCSCPNGLSRDPRSCYHAEATRRICEEYRRLSAQARRGETIRPSVSLLKALGYVRMGTSPVPIPAGALVDAKGVAYCHDCGRDLVDGRCPGDESDRFLPGDFGEHDLLGSQDLDSDPYDIDRDDAAAA